MPRDLVVEAVALPSLGPFRLLDVREPDTFDAGHQRRAMRGPIETWEAGGQGRGTSFENVGISGRHRRPRHRRPRGGHLPGVRLLYPASLPEEGRLKSADELRAMLETAGFRQNGHVVTHCDGGGRPVLAAAAAVRAGFEDVRI